jgi:hypothetical protein
MSDHKLRRRDFIYQTLLSGSATIWLGGLCSADDRIPTLGQGDFKSGRLGLDPAIFSTELLGHDPAYITEANWPELRE